MGETASGFWSFPRQGPILSSPFPVPEPESLGEAWRPRWKPRLWLQDQQTGQTLGRLAFCHLCGDLTDTVVSGTPVNKIPVEKER